MTTPSGRGEDAETSGRSGDAETPGSDAPEAPFDPYRFGLPEHPVPPEFAPPGYTPPPASAPTNPYGPPPNPYGPPSGPWAPPANPYAPANSPGPPYPPPYPAPPPSPYGSGYEPYPHRAAGNGKATAALVLGIASIVLCWTTFFDVIPVVLAIVFGILGLNQAKTRRSGGHGMALAGLICGAIGAVLAVVLTVVIVHAANQCGGLDNNNDPGFKQCVQNHF